MSSNLRESNGLSLSSIMAVSDYLHGMRNQALGILVDAITIHNAMSRSFEEHRRKQMENMINELAILAGATVDWLDNGDYSHAKIVNWTEAE